MLHSVGCPQPSAQVFVNSWNSADKSACVHAFIDANTGDGIVDPGQTDPAIIRISVLKCVNRPVSDTRAAHVLPVPM